MVVRLYFSDKKGGKAPQAAWWQSALKKTVMTSSVFHTIWMTTGKVTDTFPWLPFHQGRGGRKDRIEKVAQVLVGSMKTLVEGTL